MPRCRLRFCLRMLCETWPQIKQVTLLTVSEGRVWKSCCLIWSQRPGSNSAILRIPYIYSGYLLSLVVACCFCKTCRKVSLQDLFLFWIGLAADLKPCQATILACRSLCICPTPKMAEPEGWAKASKAKNEVMFWNCKVCKVQAVAEIYWSLVRMQEILSVIWNSWTHVRIIKHNIHTHTHIHTYAHTHIHIHTYTHTHIHTHTHTCTYIHPYIDAQIHRCTRYIDTYVHRYIRT